MTRMGGGGTECHLRHSTGRGGAAMAAGGVALSDSGQEGLAVRGVIQHNLVAPLRTVPWQLQIGQALEEHHLYATSEDASRREKFVIDLGGLLAQLDDSHVCTVDGDQVHDLEGLCRELERGLGVGKIARTIDGAGGVVDALRMRTPGVTRAAVKRRSIIWREAHVLLSENAALFGRAVDAIAGVAAEHEFCSDDVLLIQRGVFVGRPALEMYAEDVRGQFRTWYREEGEPALWRVITGRKTPGVAAWKIGAEMDGV